MSNSPIEKCHQAAEYRDKLATIFTNINREVFNWTEDWDKLLKELKPNVELLKTLANDFDKLVK